MGLFHALKPKPLDAPNPTNQFTYDTNMVICLFVTMISYDVGWRWALSVMRSTLHVDIYSMTPIPQSNSGCALLLPPQRYAFGIGRDKMDEDYIPWAKEAQENDSRLGRTSLPIRKERAWQGFDCGSRRAEVPRWNVAMPLTWILRSILSRGEHPTLIFAIKTTELTTLLIRHLCTQRVNIGALDDRVVLT